MGQAQGQDGRENPAREQQPCGERAQPQRPQSQPARNQAEQAVGAGKGWVATGGVGQCQEASWKRGLKGWGVGIPQRGACKGTGVCRAPCRRTHALGASQVVPEQAAGQRSVKRAAKWQRKGRGSGLSLRFSKLSWKCGFLRENSRFLNDGN